MSSVNYDYIVVGSGSSGSALASVLATKGKTLLIERGANHTSYPQSAYRQGWPQISVLALESVRNEGSGHWTGTANILGGGSSLNAAVCWRGERKIFTELGFDLGKVQESFEFLEDRICLQTEDTEVAQVIENAWSDLGFHLVGNSTPGMASWNDDNDGAIPSVQRARSILPLSGKRLPTSTLYEQSFHEGEPSILDQGNLTVFLLTKAKKILFNDSKEAIGVEVASPAGEFSLYVRKHGKVFLNAGVYETPKLLMLSGIGPREVLRKFKIPVIYENDEVGKNLIDRKEISMPMPLRNALDGDDILMLDVAVIGEKFWASAVHKYAGPWGNALIGCFTCAPSNRTVPCFQQIFASLAFYGSGMSSVSLPVYVAQRYPKTRGFVSLASLDYNIPPTVHDGWTTELSTLSPDARHDFDELKEGVFQLVLDTLQNSSILESLGFPNNLTGAFSSELMEVISTASNSYSNGQSMLDECTFSDYFTQNTGECDTWDTCFPTNPPLSKDPTKLEKAVFESIASSQHGAGTCQVGTVVEKGTLAVKGVHGLYVSDLSVVASPVDIHPMMTAMAIGLMVGDSIDSVPVEDYDAFPVTLSIFFMTLVMSMLSFWLVWHTQKQNEETEDERSIALRSAGRASISSIFTSMRAMPKRALERTILTGINEDIDENEEYVENVPITTALMSWTDVSCTYESGRGEKKKSVTTLSKNFGSMNEGELTAIMGPSGAAKSTLLDILSGRKSIGMVQGRFSLFGQEYNVTENGLAQLSAEIQGNSVYIPQQEYFYPTQTCAEAIHFQANMKFGRGEENARKNLVHSCLSIVGLPPKMFATRIIGGELAGGIAIRGLSGGERKRLALACMLALKPKMMFIDELTSGLDSENSYLIMKLLKDLSRRKQVASMVIIHQPDPETFALFDNLILLSKGRVVFSGNLLHMNSFYERNYDEAVPSDGYLAGDLIKKASSYDGEHQDYIGDQLEVFNTKTLYSTAYNPGKGWKLYTVFQRNLINQYVRNITNVASRFASYTGLATVIGAIFWQVGKPDETNNLSYDDAPLIMGSSIFLLNVAYLLPFATIPVFVSDKKFLAAESSLGLYPSWMYGVSQIFLEFVFLSLTMTAVTIVAFYMCAMGNPTMPEWGSFLTVLSILIMSGLVGSSMVLMTTIWLPTQDLAFLASSTIVTISLALSGAFLPFADMPVLPNALQWISPVKYSFQALVTAQITGTGAERVLYVGKLNTPSTVSENIGVLCGLFVCFSIVIAVGMARVKEIR